MDNAYKLGLAFSIGVKFSHSLKKAENRTLAMDSASSRIIDLFFKPVLAEDSGIDEDDGARWVTINHRKVKLDKDGNPVMPIGHFNVNSFLHEKKIGSKGKVIKGQLKKIEQMKTLPDFGKKGKKLGEALAPFSKVPALKAKTISEIDDKKLFIRGEPITYTTKKEKGQPSYKWIQNGKALTAKQAVAVEDALKGLKASLALNPQSTDVKVRPDLANGRGQIFTAKRGGNSLSAKSSSGKARGTSSRDPMTDYENALEKYEHVEGIIDRYSDIVGQIIQDVEDGKEGALCAYFMHRTLARVGSSDNVKTTQSVGASQLTADHFKVDGDLITCEFNGKNGFWKVQFRDSFLKGFILEKKKEYAEKMKLPKKQRDAWLKKNGRIFGASYNKVNKYLSELSERVGLKGRKLDPHDFRRINATLIARKYLDDNLTDKILNNEKAYSKLVAKSVNAAASALNDTPIMALKSYIVPSVLFKEKPELANEIPRKMFLGND